MFFCLAGGLVCERWDGVMKIVVCVYTPKTILRGTVKGGRGQGGQRGGKTTSGNGQAWSSASPRGQWRTGKNGENWLQNHLWCPNAVKGLMMMMRMMIYTFDFFFFLSAVLHLAPTKVLMESYDKHYEIILFLNNALYSDYCLVTFYLR